MTAVADIDLLTVDEAARVLRLSRAAVYRRIDAGELPVVRLGTGPRAPIRIDADELRRLISGPREGGTR